MTAATTNEEGTMKKLVAELKKILRPLGVAKTYGVTFDGERLWLVDGARGRLVSMNPETGALRDEFPSMDADAGVAHDGTHLWLLAGGEILKIDPERGTIVSRLAVAGSEKWSGVAWAEGYLWVGDYKAHRMHKVDPETGEILKTLHSDRLVTGVTWAGDELWHGSGTDVEEGAPRSSEYELRRIDPETGEVLEVLAMPEGAPCSGLAADDSGTLWCGDCDTGEVRAVVRPTAA